MERKFTVLRKSFTFTHQFFYDQARAYQKRGQFLDAQAAYLQAIRLLRWEERQLRAWRRLKELMRNCQGG